MIKVCMTDTNTHRLWCLNMETIPRIGETVSIIENEKVSDYLVTDVKTVVNYTEDTSKTASISYIIVLNRKEEECMQKVFHSWEFNLSGKKENTSQKIMQ